MSIIRSAYTLAAVSFAVAVVMETADGTDGSIERVLTRAYDKVSTTAISAIEVALAYIPANHPGTETLRLVGR